ncbi:MAG: OmpA family protein [Flavobacteriales bacterium]|jgi:outer membrane protein OmpA-like peptidoglycan-associated protein|nr:OmpA family protein [Flavobacteriales bacterium]MCB0759846.1 OmpA family protein [Flavobacteriales bacterium]
MLHRTVFCAFVSVLLALPTLAQDASGCTDHPVITRYPGSALAWCEEQNHVEYAIARGPITGYRQIADWTEVSGKRTRLYYVIKGTTSLRDIYLNYQNALKGAQATILAQGTQEKSTSPEIGSRTFLGVFLSRNELPSSAGLKLLNGSATSGGTFYIAGSMSAGGVPVHVVVSGAQYSSEEKLVLVDIIEEVAIATDKIKVNAEWMKQQLELYGKVAINDVLFDTDKATVQASSLPVIAEIAKVLGMLPKLNVYIVGHTDMTGTLHHNMELSGERANEVVRILTTDHAVAAARMEGYGVGPLAPVATNKTDEGKQLNRRVELVAR